MNKLILTVLFTVTQLCNYTFAQVENTNTEIPFSNSIKGIPRILHYTKNDFNSDTQFWSMCQDKDGVLYFGNNEGVLIYDGEHWQYIHLPNRSSMRSLLQAKDGTIYAGGFNDFGTIEKDEFGKYQYNSLMHLIRVEDKNLENLWDVQEVQGHIVFRSFRMLVAISNNKAITLPPPNGSQFTFSTEVNNRYYVQDNEGLKHLDLNSMEFSSFVEPEEINHEDIVELLPGNSDNELLAFTKQGSIFKIDPETTEVTFWKSILKSSSNNLITCGLKAATGDYYLGTLSTKVIALNKFGEEISNDTFYNLQDKTVLNIFESNEGNIWALLNNGLDCIDISSPVSLLFENASIFDVLFEGNSMYIASNQGVFYCDDISKSSNLSRSNFVKIQGLEGQVWSLKKVNGQIICGHDRGLFVVSKDKSKKLSELQGIWKVVPIKGFANHYLVCTYETMYLMSFSEKDGFKLEHKIQGFNESSRDIVQTEEPGVFWVCHGYKGVFKVKINDEYTRVISVEHYRDQNGLPSAFNINVFKWNNDVVFTSNEGVYTYNEKENQFLPHEELSKILGKNASIRKIIEHNDKTWFVQDEEAGYFYNNDDTGNLYKGLFLQLKGSFSKGMECIIPVGSNLVLMGTVTGLYAFELDQTANKINHETNIISISYKNAAEEVNGKLVTGSDNFQILPNLSSTITFEFASPSFNDKTNVQFSYKLEGLDESWSAWQETPFKEYSHIKAGEYIFKVKARSLLGETAEPANYYFKILPAWYQSQWAITIYVIAAFLLILITVMWVKRKIFIENEKVRKEEFKARKVLELEIEQMKLQQDKERMQRVKEKLEYDVIDKSKELANYTMLLVKKQEAMTELKKELNELKTVARNDTMRKKVRDLIRKITVNLDDKEYVQIFEANFERVHHQFFQNLKSSFPDLTQKELRLCALVKMSLSNKDISQMFNISVRGVETARYRLRKKLNLEHEDNMVDFFEKFDPPKVEKTH
ncbi:triple tyrosine motif-containing protein [Chondrinema litorale]|uniref:triple tyrosine motif-containing protein n=1 Tax=Chondrinema litorale TaxID=2994555 RepID=UPI002542C3FF|nr:triple tyrosine motif-containing protein [Chondrinema litorale]UZR97541.1 triple tyrosine motif-containing protein [Chondrinema litorale]